KTLSNGTLDLDDFEYFDHIASADVVVVLNADTTFHTVTDFVNVIFEAAQGLQLAFVDNHVVTQNADRVVTFNHTFGNHTACDGTKFRRFEHVTNFRQTDNLLFQFRRQHTAHRRFHFVNQVIDDGVVTQIQAFRFNHFTCRGISTYVEANQDGVGRRSQGGVGFGDTTYARTDDLHFNFVSRQFQQGVGDRFHRTLYVCLQDDVHFVNFAFGHVGEHVLEFR